MSSFSIGRIVFLDYERLKTSFPHSGEVLCRAARAVTGQPVCGLATALPLTAERTVSAMGFERGNEGLERGENKEPNKADACNHAALRPIVLLHGGEVLLVIGLRLACGVVLR
jgi:hypothetical protein